MRDGRDGGDVGNAGVDLFQITLRAGDFEILGSCRKLLDFRPSLVLIVGITFLSPVHEPCTHLD